MPFTKCSKDEEIEGDHWGGMFMAVRREIKGRTRHMGDPRGSEMGWEEGRWVDEEEIEKEEGRTMR